MAVRKKQLTVTGGIMKALLKKSDWTKSMIALLIAAGFAISAHAQTQGIAKIVSSKGNIVLENQSVWVRNPEPGKIIYHGDKILTMPDSSVQLQFDDGAVLDISANSNVRITQAVQKGQAAEEELGKREVRTFIGKVTYKSGENKKISTSMVSPTAVAALRGTIVEFGTDGNYTLLNRIEGNSTNTGNITEGYVPEIKPEQAAKNTGYQAVVNTSKAWDKYQDAVKAKSPEAAVLLIQAVKIANESMLVENKSLENNPDPIVKARASDGVKKSEEAIKKADESLKTVTNLQQKIQDNTVKSEKQPENKEAYQLVVKAATEAQEAVVNSVKASMEVAESHTASLYGKEANQIEHATMKNIEMAVDMATSAEKKVEALVIKSVTANDVNVAAAALKSAAIVAASAEANSAVTDVAIKSVQSEIAGDKAETKKLEQTMTTTLETAGNIGDKAMQTEAIVEKVEKAVERGDTTTVKEALQEVNAVQKEVNAEVKTLPVSPSPIQTTTQTTATTPTTATGTTTTPAADAAAAQTTTTTPTTSTDTTTAADTGTTQSTTPSTSPDTGGTSPTTLMQQPPPFQDALKTNTTPPYGQ